MHVTNVFIFNSVQAGDCNQNSPSSGGLDFDLGLNLSKDHSSVSAKACISCSCSILVFYFHTSPTSHVLISCKNFLCKWCCIHKDRKSNESNNCTIFDPQGICSAEIRIKHCWGMSICSQSAELTCQIN